VTTGARSLRRRLTAETGGEFSVFPELHAAGQTEYLAIVDRLGTAESIGEMDCVYSSWTTDAPGGFQDHEVRAIERASPFLALAVKAAGLAEIARTLVETYLGRDAGRRVLTGRIVRGLADRIHAVLWFSDLRDYTRISDMAEPEQIIPLLNDYADLVVTAIHRQGGDVLKFVGDGVLALFTQDAQAAACAAAVAAAQAARGGIVGLNARRHAEGLPTTDFRLGLHLGPVFYGNIGSPDRLDFTVVGPAVNEVSRIAAMCRALDQPVLLSSAFATTLDPERRRFASVGRYALRGVARPQELFTLDPEREPGSRPAPSETTPG
jgi:adenylate cyclase